MAIDVKKLCGRRMKKKLHLWIILLLSASPFSKHLVAQETTPNVFASDCADVQLETIDPAKLTKEERIKLLEASLFDSIDKTTDCMQKAQDSMTKTMAKGLNSSSNSGSNTGASSNANSESQNEQSQQKNEPHSETNTQVTGNNSGSENQGIAEQDNDKLICMALKQDVDNEQDPQKKAKLAEQLKSYSMCNKYFR